MISLSQTRYGSGRRPGGARQGRSRRWRSYHARSTAGSGNRSGDSARREGSGENSGRIDMSRGNKDSTVSGVAAGSERRPGLRTLGGAVARLTAPVIARGGGLLARLKASWPAIVGEELGAATWPSALSRAGALKLCVASGLALEIQHRTPLLIERLNLFLGRGAVARIVLVQGPLPLPA